MQEINHFQDIQLSPIILQALHRLGFSKPTAIQAQAIPLALQSKDILGSAQTGTGKTFAFCLPLLDWLLNNPTGKGLILIPTRELAQQIFSNLNKLLAEIQTIKLALLIGGESYNKQLKQIESPARIIIGTPGRIIDHLQQKNFSVAGINYLVLDETDRMFDMGFAIQLEKIVSQLPKKRQTLMFSATFPAKIERLVDKYMQDPVRIFVNESQKTGIQLPSSLVEKTLSVKEEDKYAALLQELNQREGTILIFVKTKVRAEKLSLKLRKENYNTCAMHSNLVQNKRVRLMEAFRQERYRIMVATDVAARGLDVPHLLHVINYDLPHLTEDYVHRLGRTARNGKEGFAFTFLTPEDSKRWKAIQLLLDPVGKVEHGPYRPIKNNLIKNNLRKGYIKGRLRQRPKDRF
jgi:superfamily II DNA/RNA helicase